MKTWSEIKSCRTNFLRILSLIALLVLPVFPSAGQIDTTKIKKHDQEHPKKYVSLFDSDDILEVFLRLNLSGFLKKTDRNQSFDGIMTIHFSETDSIDKKVTVKYRGENRYQTCRFPPMRISFKKPLYESSDSGRIKSMKLVNQCQLGASYEEYIIRECLVYKLYNVVTDTSFRVRLLKINFIDSEKKKKSIIQYGIFIEPEELLASRTNTLELKATSLSQRHMFPAMIDRIAIFNYMVSNWDWSVAGLHNVSVLKSLRLDVEGLGIPVPFDFDLTGVVNAEYSIPPPDMGIATNRDRKFSGICRTRGDYQKDLMMFLDKKEDFYSVVNNYPYLSKGAKKDIIAFLDQFFDQLEKQKSLDNLIYFFLENCKKL